MKEGLVQLMNGDYQVVDQEDEDAPLITILFHNEAAKIPQLTKLQLVRQMMDPSSHPSFPFKGRLILYQAMWWLLGIGMGYVFHSMVRFAKAM